MTAKSTSSFAIEKEGLPARPKAIPAAVVFKKLRRVIPCFHSPIIYSLCSLSPLTFFLSPEGLYHNMKRPPFGKGGEAVGWKRFGAVTFGCTNSALPRV
jgi:hypothetical protein